MIQTIFGLLILAIGGYVLYLGISSLTSGTQGSRGSTLGRLAVLLLGAGIAFVGVAMLVVGRG